MVEVVDYVMLKDPNAPNGLGWSQIGLAYNTTATNGVEIFAQYTRTSDFVTVYGPATNLGTVVPYFTVLYNYVPGRFTYQVNGSQWIPFGYSGGYNPTAYFTPHGVEVGGEIHNRADQMPGGTTSYAAHFNAHLHYNGAWQDGWLTTYMAPSAAFPELGIEPPAGSLAYYNGRDLYIWDKDCAT